MQKQKMHSWLPIIPHSWRAHYFWILLFLISLLSPNKVEGEGALLTTADLLPTLSSLYTENRHH
jgi:hypothetical protein